ncbi:hypothetical protein DVH26_27055 [Paenibacillus sp. H1-7]|nr:hypothetical protein DVH26_27055 [Paenibacillus sp. H1-7]
MPDHIKKRCHIAAPAFIRELVVPVRIHMKRLDGCITAQSGPLMDTFSPLLVGILLAFLPGKPVRQRRPSKFPSDTENVFQTCPFPTFYHIIYISSYYFQKDRAHKSIERTKKQPAN